MNNWNYEEETGKSKCPNVDDYIYARKVCEQIKIPLETVQNVYYIRLISPKNIGILCLQIC